MESYGQIDQQIADFQAATQLHCPSGCGWCCENPTVEATPLEMLPLALELFRRGEADQWLARATQIYQAGGNATGVCVFYRPDPLVEGNGRCQVYQWRPSICRLFGFATVTSKVGQPELAACVRHKALLPDIVAATQEAIAQGLPAPSFAQLSQQVANIDPYLGRQQMPINQALKIALERVGLSLQMNQQALEESDPRP